MFDIYIGPLIVKTRVSGCVCTLTSGTFKNLMETARISGNVFYFIFIFIIFLNLIILKIKIGLDARNTL